MSTYKIFESNEAERRKGREGLCATEVHSNHKRVDFKLAGSVVGAAKEKKLSKPDWNGFIIGMKMTAEFKRVHAAETVAVAMHRSARRQCLSVAQKQRQPALRGNLLLSLALQPPFRGAQGACWERRCRLAAPAAHDSDTAGSSDTAAATQVAKLDEVINLLLACKSQDEVRICMLMTGASADIREELPARQKALLSKLTCCKKAATAREAFANPPCPQLSHAH